MGQADNPFVPISRDLASIERRLREAAGKLIPASEDRALRENLRQQLLETRAEITRLQRRLAKLSGEV